jgi:hypothetical protein
MPEGFQQKTETNLPFQGVWYVIQDYRPGHAFSHTDPHQRAWDFTIIDATGHCYAGDPTPGILRVALLDADSRADYFRPIPALTNQAFYCFGKAVLSPGNGRIARAVDGIPDNEPHVLNEEKPFGNYVAVDHGHEEYSFLLHLKLGSVAVSIGQKVRRGQLLGMCGNSGYSPEPHLHLHFQGNASPEKPVAIPMTFGEYYLMNGLEKVRIERGSPERGQFIASK